MRMRSFSILVAVMLTASVTASAALFETADFPLTCEGSAPITVPMEMQGKFMDTKTTGWLEVGPLGITRVDWKGFNFHSRGFAEKGYCVRHELKPMDDGAQGVFLSIEQAQSGVISESDSYSVAVGLRKDTQAYYFTSNSSGSFKLGFIPFGGSTAMSAETPVIRKAPKAPAPKAPEATTRKLSSR